MKAGVYLLGICILYGLTMTAGFENEEGNGLSLSLVEEVGLMLEFGVENEEGNGLSLSFVEEVGLMLKVGVYLLGICILCTGLR